MKFKKFLIIFLIWIFHIRCNEDIIPKIKLGIIGAGIGGTYTAYEILKSHKNFEVDLYDKKWKEGGRIYTEMKDDLNLDLGGSYFLEGQQFIESLIQEFNIETRLGKKKSSFGIFSRNEIMIKLSDNNAWNLLKLFWRYGLSSLSSKKIIDIQHNHFQRLYKKLQNKNYFTSIGDFLSYMGCEELISQTLEEYLSPVVSQKYLDEIINSQVLSIFMQEAKSINAFTGLFALENFNKPFKRIVNGSYELVHKLLERSEMNKNFNFLNNHRVIEIHKHNNKYLIITDKGDRKEYDIVIIAAPLYINNRIKFFGDFNFKDESKLYFNPVSSEIAYVKGKINKSYFKLGENEEMPNSLITSKKDSDDYIVSIHHVREDIYKLKGLNLVSLLDKMFSNYEIIKIKKWDFQCPNFKTYKSTDDLPDFILDENLYYLNSIESIADGIEISLISAHNMVNLIDNCMKKLHGKESKDEF
jgi:hypothetical protein